MVRKSRKERIAEEEGKTARQVQRRNPNDDLVQNQDLLEQIARLNRNRTQMKESLSKSRSTTNRQSKH